MNKEHEEILAKIRESVIEAQTRKYDFRCNRDCRKYSEEVLKTIKSKLKEIDFPIFVEESDGRRVLLSDPKLIIHDPDKDNINIVSFSIIGKHISTIENTEI